METRAPIQHVFFSLGIGKPQLSRYEFEGRDGLGSFMVSALSSLGLLDQPAFRLRFHLVATPQVTRETVQRLAGELGDSLRRAVGELFLEIWDRRILMENGDVSRRAHELIPYMLREVSDGDRIFLEPTQGLRPIQMAFSVGTSLLSTLMKVETAPFYYAEPIQGEPAAFQVTAVKDMLASLHQTMAVRDLLHHLRPSTLAGPAMGRLDLLSDALDGGNTRLLCSQLPQLELGSAERESLNPVVAWALARFRTFFPETKFDDPAENTPSNDFLLDVELDLVERLRIAGRHGDALRVLREHIVNMTTLAILPDRHLDPFSIAARHLFERHGLQAKNKRHRAPVPAAAFFFMLSEQRNLFTHGAFKGDTPGSGASLKVAMERAGDLTSLAGELPTPAAESLRLLSADVGAGRGDSWLSQPQLDAVLVLLPALLRRDREALFAHWQRSWTAPADQGLVAWQDGNGWRWCFVAGKPPLDGAAAASLQPSLDALTSSPWENDKMHLKFATWTLLFEQNRSASPSGWQQLPGRVERYDSGTGILTALKAEGA